MSSEQQLADHWLKRNETLNAFILFEGGALSQEMLQIMMEHYKYRRISLYQLPDLKKVAAYGPWLVRTGVSACCGMYGKNAGWS